MITAPLTAPKEGMILFSERYGLMVTVTSVRSSGFGFHVLNGNWDGEVEHGNIRIENAEYPNATVGESDFAQVISVTRHEFDAWYMRRASGAQTLINRPVDPVPTPEASDPVQEVTLLVTVLGQADGPRSLANWVSGLRLEDIAREMDVGELVGTVRVIGSLEIPPAEVRTRLEAVGNDGTFFEGVGQTGKVEPVADRISELRDQQGWSAASMEHLAANFIRDAGLERAFLAHLEAQAEKENQYTGADFEP